MEKQKNCPVKKAIGYAREAWPSVPSVLLALSLLYFFALINLTAAEWASWVQAVGTIVAVGVAAYLPIWHSRVASKNRQNDLAQILRVISDDALDLMWALTDVFHDPQQELVKMVRYHNSHQGRSWDAVSDQLAQIPVAELSPAIAKDLSYLKDSVNFGGYAASLIPDFLQKKQSQLHVVNILRYKRDLVREIRLRLPVPAGVVSHEFPQSEMAGRCAEMRRPVYKPLLIGEAQIYRRYVWSHEFSGVPDFAIVNGEYPVGENFGPYIIESNGTWSSLHEAEEYVKLMCVQLHKEHIEAMDLKIMQEAL
ncbi:hypothetical protein [Pseudomonas sp. MF6396]|uniref:hypothetical protein n=1 Tax=Pseudomonas sp. MF6396 TaxID=1960828 RepID=UPI00128FDC14|nr:hypothetical protein [Pseudomonas sp. MF6396]